MTPVDIQSLLKPGDCLLYKPKGFFGWLIKLKTWHNIAHCEMYTGNGRSVASRDGLGVGSYPWRDTELAYILRPPAGLDWAAFWKWFLTVNGEPYDWYGLFRFAWFKEIGGENNGKMFCSEFLTRAYRALGAKVFGDVEDADAVAPGDFLKSPNLTVIATEASLRS